MNIANRDADIGAALWPLFELSGAPAVRLRTTGEVIGFNQAASPWLSRNLERGAELEQTLRRLVGQLAQHPEVAETTLELPSFGRCRVLLAPVGDTVWALLEQDRERSMRSEAAALADLLWAVRTGLTENDGSAMAGFLARALEPLHPVGRLQLYRFDPSESALRLAADTHQASAGSEAHVSTQHLLGQAYLNRALTLARSPQQDGLLDVTDETRPALVLPVSGRSSTHGMLALFAPDGAWTDGRLRLARATADALGSVLDHVVRDERLLHERRRLERLMDNLPDAIFEADPTGRIVLARGRVEPIFGAPGERFLGQSFNSLVVPDDRPLLSRLLHAEAPSPHDVRITRPDDAVRVCEVSLHRASEGITRAIFRDQTEQREWETKIQEAQSIAQSRERLATIGMMTAGVAHEINNPLAFIGANLRYVKDALKPLVAAPDASPELSAAREAIDESLEGFNRITRIVNALRGTARNAPNERVVFWPAHALREAVTVFTGAKRGVCSVEEDLPEVSQVVGSPSGLAQVVLNLLQNGLDAMDGHGQLGVRCRDQDKEVWVEVWDRGPGIPEEVQARMFLPFYTTKAFGKGTGLGLHLCKGIVAEMDGQLTYTTGPAGTTFRIQLPQLEAEEG